MKRVIKAIEWIAVIGGIIIIIVGLLGILAVDRQVNKQDGNRGYESHSTQHLPNNKTNWASKTSTKTNPKSH